MVSTVISVFKKYDADHLLGQFLDGNSYDQLVDCDMIGYREMDAVENEQHNGKNGEHNVIFMFKKGYFTKAQQEGAYDGLRDAAQQTQNRGLAAGPKGIKLQNREWLTNDQYAVLHALSNLNETALDNDYNALIEHAMATAAKRMETRGMVWLTSENEAHNFKYDEWLPEVLKKPAAEAKKSAQWVLDTLISETSYANPVDSGIAGWFDRYPRIPYGRPTAYTFHNFDKFKLCYPFMEALDKAFKILLPKRHAVQTEMAKKLDPSFYIPNTCFTTITVNKNFRTAAHRDAGDLAEGFSNLTVVAKDKNYKGGYLVLPEIRAAINIRPGDLLLVANHEYIHGNTPIESAGDATDLERISLVCYFREAMKELGERAYEDHRYNFVESRRKNKEHPLWVPKWNGVSTDMWSSQEWFDYLNEQGGGQYIEMYHADAVAKQSSLESLFSE